MRELSCGLPPTAGCLPESLRLNQERRNLPSNLELPFLRDPAARDLFLIRMQDYGINEMDVR